MKEEPNLSSPLCKPREGASMADASARQMRSAVQVLQRPMVMDSFARANCCSEGLVQHRCSTLCAKHKRAVWPELG